jgi:hypothetical protein
VDRTVKLRNNKSQKLDSENDLWPVSLLAPQGKPLCPGHSQAKGLATKNLSLVHRFHFYNHYLVIPRTAKVISESINKMSVATNKA